MRKENQPESFQPCSAATVLVGASWKSAKSPKSSSSSSFAPPLQMSAVTMSLLDTVASAVNTVAEEDDTVAATVEFSGTTSVTGQATTGAVSADALWISDSEASAGVREDAELSAESDDVVGVVSGNSWSASVSERSEPDGRAESGESVDEIGFVQSKMKWYEKKTLFTRHDTLGDKNLDYEYGKPNDLTKVAKKQLTERCVLKVAIFLQRIYNLLIRRSKKKNKILQHQLRSSDTNLVQRAPCD